MIKTEFGIIDKIDSQKDYSEYEPQKYGCIAIDDEAYIDDWWAQLKQLNTYFHCLKRPETGLARWGVTLIPPESLTALKRIVLNDDRICSDKNLAVLAGKIQQAIDENKFMIHYGI